MKARPPFMTSRRRARSSSNRMLSSGLPSSTSTSAKRPASSTPTSARPTQAAAWLAAPAVAQPAYVYYYNQVLVLVDIIDLFRNLRVFHGSELVSVFDLTVLLWNDAEVAMAKTFVSYWSNFAVTGNPAVGPATVPAWPAFGAAGNVAIISAIEGPPVSRTNVTIVQGVNADKCAFWAQTPIAESVIWG